jgi:hypothetical protein
MFTPEDIEAKMQRMQDILIELRDIKTNDLPHRTDTLTEEYGILMKDVQEYTGGSKGAITQTVRPDKD